MAAPTIIDQLIVKLGLDPGDFSKGRKKAAAETLALEKDVKKSSEGMSASVVGFTKKLLGIAGAAIVVKKAIGYVSDMSTTVRQLGIDSRNFGVAANELRNFQNVAEMFGGKGEEVTKTVGNITRAVYDLAYNGQISDSLVMLGRLGVRFQDTTGKARSFRDIVLDTEKAIQGRMRSGNLSRENANQMLVQAGFDPGLAQAILSGNVGQQLARQEARRQVSGESIKAATEWEQSAANRDQAIAAGTLRALPGAAAAGVAANNAIAATADYASNVTAAGAARDIGRTMGEAADGVKAGAGKLVDALESVGARTLRAMYPKGRQNYEASIQRAAKRYGIDPEMLAGVLGTESDFDPAAVNKDSGATGIAQLMPKYFPKAGLNPHEDIDTAASYLKTLRDSYQKQGYGEDDAYYYALQSYNAGQSRVRKAIAGKGPPLRQETLDYPGKVLSYAAGAVPTPGAQNSGGSTSSNKTEVNIGKVDVVTRATDADGIARDFAGATKRKLMAAQADVGMQ